jgi:hypothetical protein
MSVSDNSTIAPSIDIDGPFQSQDEHVKNPHNQDGEGFVLKTVRHTKRLRRSPFQSIAAVYAEHHPDESEAINHRVDCMPKECEGDDTVVSYEKS